MISAVQRIAGLTALSLSCSPLLAQQAPPQPFRLNDWIEGPSWVSFSGRHRTRFESLDKQFRAGARPEHEDQWFVRTSVRADMDWGTFGGTAELMDSRAWGDDPNRQASTAFVNSP